MEINVTAGLRPVVLAIQAQQPAAQTTPVAFGIGQDSVVELSPQAQIIQQSERNQLNNQASAAPSQNQEAGADEQLNIDFVRVSSSVGNAQKNSLSSEQAAELYRSIEKLL